MTQLRTQQYADLSKDAYETRQVTKGDNSILVEGNRYKVLAVHDNPKTGYQGTVYQDVKTKEIIAAHRGTAPPQKTLSMPKPTSKPYLSASICRYIIMPV